MSDQTDQEQRSARPGKAELLQRIQTSRAELEVALRALDDEQLLSPGREGWSVRDHLAHLAAWEGGIAALLRRQPRLEAMGLDPAAIEGLSTDEINDQIHSHFVGLSLGEVMDFFHQTHRTLMDILTRLSDEDLYLPYADYVPDGSDSRQDPVINWIFGNTFEHYNEHLGYIREILAER